jgi:PAS domain S-box-containing protein
MSRPTRLVVNGKPIGFQAITVDITERRRSEERLLMSEERYRCIFENTSDGLLYLDEFGRILEANRKAVEIYGGRKKELLEKRFTELGVIHPEDVPRLVASIARIFAGREGTTEISIRNKKGEDKLLECTSSLLRIGDKNNGVMVSVRDVTESKRAEQTIRESQEKFERLFVDNPEAAVYWDSDFRVLDINPRFTGLFGYSLNEARGKRDADIIIPKDRIEESELLGKMAKEGYVDYDTVRKKKDGSLIHVSLSVAPMVVDDKLIGYVGLHKDITERKRVEDALRESAERYRSLFESARDLIITVDLEGNITSANNMVLEYGYERNELVGKSVFNLFSEEYWRVFQDYFRKLTEGKPIEGEFKIKSRQMQRYSIVEYRSNPIIQDGKVVGAQVIVRDVTERREIEEKLRDSEEKFRAINASANDAILLIDDEGKFSYWNPAAEKMFGYTKEEADNKKMYELITPERFRGDHTSAFEKFKKTGEGRIIGKTVEMAAIRKDGTEFPVEFSLSALQVKEKQYALGIVRDITERKKMEERLKQYSEHLEELVEKKTNELLESEKRYSALVEEANDGVAIIQDEKIVFANKKAPGIIGYTREEMIGLPLETFLDENYRQHVKELYQRKLRGEAAPPTLEMEWIAKTSEHVPVELSATLINYLGSPAILVIIRDISERKRIEKQHAKLEKLATIGELATMVAHDLRNPLTSIRNASFYVKGTCPHRENTECRAALEMLNIIDQETIFANNIINELLEFSTKGPLQKGKKNINRIIEDSLKVSNIPKSINIEKHFAGKTTARVDKGQLQRVFLNIIQNAAHSMPNGGKLIITTTGTKDHVEITFTDTGTGMAEEDMSKLFTPFFTTKAKGIGLGLAICKRIVEEHGGTIGFKSKVGQGTTFTIALPKKKEESNL